MVSYQGILTNELLSRKRKNPAYSTRSFARDLGVSQSFLIQVLNKKRKLGGERAEAIAERLRLKPVQRKLFVNLVRLDLSDSPHSRDILQTEVEALLRRNPGFSVLSEDRFNIVADWYYFAIVELTAVRGFRNDPEWIARKLGLSVPEVSEALERLKRVGLVAEREGSLAKTEENYLFERDKSAIPSAAIRRHHQQTLRLAGAALESQPVGEREYFTVTIPMDPKSISRAKSAIREFSEQLMAELQESQPRALYKLAIQFFRLDKEIS
ncbi:MAG TPA: TIGR02147 family protein [Bdellovibrionales bacterium]|nr:TIGR02147 family protein [Bdellovibrionales bacterium]